MIAEKMKGMVAGSSAIRAMFEEGTRMAEQFGAENVYDFSLGNPNVPAPASVKKAIMELLEEEDPVVLHGYTNSNSGYADVRETVAASLNRRFGTSFEGNEYFEGPSIRKINEKYYLIYSSVNTHQLCYAVSKQPMDGFTFGGVIVSNGDVGYMGRKEEDKLMSVGNNHGGLVEVDGQWYIFYHRHTYINQYNRQGCAERVYFDKNGHIPQVTITTSGMNPRPLSGNASYPAVYCCNLTNGHMGPLSSIGRSNPEVDFPFMTAENGERFITNIKDGNLIGYKYINLSMTKEIEVVYQTDTSGQLEIYTEMNGEKKGSICLEESDWWKTAGTKVSFDKETELYFVYRGQGRLSFLTLNLRAW